MIVVLVGASGTGKSTIEKVLSEQFNYSKIISYTTRSPRMNEVNHEDYHFISNEEFNQMKDNNLFAEYDIYSQNRQYGGLKEDYNIDKNIVCVLTPNGLRQLKKSGIDPIVVYVTCNLKTKVTRYADRISDTSFSIEDLQELYARAERDFGMFTGMEHEADIVIENNGKDTPITIAKRIIVKISEIYNERKKEGIT